MHRAQVVYSQMTALAQRLLDYSNNLNAGLPSAMAKPRRSRK